MNKNITFFVIAALLSSFKVSIAQYARGDEKPIRPSHETSDTDIQKTMSLEEYTAQEAANRVPEKQSPILLENPVQNTTIGDTLTPMPMSGKTKTIVIEQAIFRCEKGNGFVFVDEDTKNKFSRCSLFRPEKTAEVLIEPEPVMPLKPANYCSGTLFYRGNTYIFNENEPCPIPESVLNQLLPVATRPF